jgi:hypothetical protein
MRIAPNEALQLLMLNYGTYKAYGQPLALPSGRPWRAVLASARLFTGVQEDRKAYFEQGSSLLKRHFYFYYQWFK